MFQVINQNLIDAGFTIEPTALPWNPDYLNAVQAGGADIHLLGWTGCLLYTSPSPRDLSTSRMPSSA